MSRFINDIALYRRWAAIARYLPNHNHPVVEYRGMLAYNQQFLLAKHSTKWRLLSHLDWAHYTPKGLADAITNNTIEQYYEQQLHDVRSDPNIWRRPDEEHTLKARYAARAGRASLIPK
jgi:hypothetical protein